MQDALSGVCRRRRGADVTDFTPWQSLAGGGLIGLAAVLLMLTTGRIMGATGVLAGFLRPASRTDWLWRAVLIAGMVTAPLLGRGVTGGGPVISVPVPAPMLLLGGFTVGLGVTFGGGCPRGTGTAAWPVCRPGPSPRRWCS